MELLAACSMARHPADIVLTDSFKYNILRLRGQRLIFWADLPPETALVAIADMLRQVNLFFCPSHFLNQPLVSIYLTAKVAILY